MAMGRTFKEDPKRTLIKAKIKAGSIIYLPCNFIIDPHKKFMVVAHVDYTEELMLVFLINSQIHPLIEKDPLLKHCQVLLKKTIYTFLDHDSHLNCAKAFDDVIIDEAVDFLLREPQNYKGHLHDDEILSVIEAVNSTSTIPEYDKDLIIASLGG
jgi:hypothetical protein